MSYQQVKIIIWWICSYNDCGDCLRLYIECLLLATLTIHCIQYFPVLLSESEGNGRRGVQQHSKYETYGYRISCAAIWTEKIWIIRWLQESISWKMFRKRSQNVYTNDAAIILFVLSAPSSPSSCEIQCVFVCIPFSLSLFYGTDLWWQCRLSLSCASKVNCAIYNPHGYRDKLNIAN